MIGWRRFSSCGVTSIFGIGAMDAAALRERMNRLVAQREALEIEAQAITAELTSPGPNGERPAGIKDPLVDAEGFPRGDIDLFNVRAKRSRLSHIQTDYKELMKELETVVHSLHQLGASATRTSTETGPTATRSGGDLRAASNSEGVDEHKEEAGSLVAENVESLEAFAYINDVSEGSPAAAAGLKTGDRLLRFGDVTKANNEQLRAIPGVVRQHLGGEIPLVVRRGEFVHQLSLQPRSWAGQGLIGCHLMPLN